MVCRQREEPGQVLGQARQAHRLVQALQEGQEHLLSRRCLDQVVRGRRHQRRVQLHRPAPEEARRPDGDHLGRRQPLRRQEDHLQRTLRARLPSRQRAEEARRQEGRPRHDLHADDPRSGLCDARMRSDRRDPFGGVRRLLAGFARRPHRRLQVDLRHHCRRRSARRQGDPAEGEYRQGDRDRRQGRHQGEDRAGGAPHRRQDRLGRRTRPLVPSGGRDR